MDGDRGAPKNSTHKTRVGLARAALRARDRDYTDVEKRLVLTYLETELTVPTLKDFLRERRMQLSGTKPELLARIREAVDAGVVSYANLVALLDSVLPWGPQHVVLLGEPKGLSVPAATYRDPALFEAHLRAHGAARAFRDALPLILPESLSVSSIEHSEDRVRVSAVERRDGFTRVEAMDVWKKDEHGRDVHMRAFVEEVTRGLIVFEWDFNTNLAMLQITRLPSGDDYDKAELRFRRVVGKWIDLSRFPRVDLRIGMKALHSEEITKGSTSRARAHGIKYDTLHGGSVEATSATSNLSLMADPDASGAANTARQRGVGRKGNFYWRHAPTLPKGHRGLHVKVLAKAGRVHFPTGQAEEDIRHVLEDIRAVC